MAGPRIEGRFGLRGAIDRTPFPEPRVDADLDVGGIPWQSAAGRGMPESQCGGQGKPRRHGLDGAWNAGCDDDRARCRAGSGRTMAKG